MRLRDVARVFNKTQCLDAYTGLGAFFAQVLPYDDVRRDASTYERRIFSVDPSVSVPSRRVASAMGRQWILGQPSPDQYLGEDIRHGYVGHEATTLARLRTIGQVLLNTGGVQAYAGRAFARNAAFTQQTSHLAVQWEVYLSSAEAATEGSIIEFDGSLLVVRASHKAETGMLKVNAEDLGPGALQTVTVTHGTWNPLTETLTGGTVSTQALFLRWQALYSYGNPVAPDFAAGDVQIALSSATVPAPIGATVALVDGSRWLLKSASVMPGGGWLCRATKHV